MNQKAEETKTLTEYWEVMPYLDPWPANPTDDYAQRNSEDKSKTPNHVPNFHSNGGTFDGGGASGDWQRESDVTTSSDSDSSSSSCDSSSSSSGGLE